jgi:transcriptional regulator with XRE-family HTH domain
MSTLSVKSKTKKIREIPSTQDLSPTQYGLEVVALRPSNSRKREIYKTAEFQSEWANDIRFHVARNVLHLRRYRGLSQKDVADAMNTSQSAIARIESAQENITLDTLQRLVGALEGRFEVTIYPQEDAVKLTHPWWKPTINPWKVCGTAVSYTADTTQLLVGLERQSYQPPVGTFNMSVGMLPRGAKAIPAKGL